MVRREISPEMTKLLDETGLAKQLQYGAYALIALFIAGAFVPVIGQLFFPAIVVLVVYFIARISIASSKKMKIEEAAHVVEHPLPVQSKSFFEKIEFRLNTVVLIVSNLLFIGYAVLVNASLSEILIVYLAQTVVLFFLAIIKVYSLRQFTVSRASMQVNQFYGGQNNFWSFVKPNDSYSKLIAVTYLACFGLVSLVLYGTFLFLIFDAFKNINLWFVASSTAIFGLNHLFSFFYTQKNKAQKTEFIDLYFNQALMRIIPLHIFLFVGLFFINKSVGIGIITFCLLKMLIDLGTHLNEHRVNNETVSPEELSVQISPTDRENQKKIFQAAFAFLIMALLWAGGMAAVFCIVSTSHQERIQDTAEYKLGDCLGLEFIGYINHSGNCYFDLNKGNNWNTFLISRAFSGRTGSYLSGQEPSSPAFKAGACFINNNNDLMLDGNLIKNISQTDQNVRAHLLCYMGEPNFSWAANRDSPCTRALICTKPNEACCLITFLEE